jgi:predicted GTPase
MVNVALVGRRGTGKTTWCYRLCGLVPPRVPPGTASVSYLACQLDGNEYMFWDFPPGLGAHVDDILHDMDVIVLCYNGRGLSDSVGVLQSRYPSAKLLVAVTQSHALSVIHLHDWSVSLWQRVPLCYTIHDVWRHV